MRIQSSGSLCCLPCLANSYCHCQYLIDSSSECQYFLNQYRTRNLSCFEEWLKSSFRLNSEKPFFIAILYKGMFCDRLRLLKLKGLFIMSISPSVADVARCYLLHPSFLSKAHRKVLKPPLQIRSGHCSPG